METISIHPPSLGAFYLNFKEKVMEQFIKEYSFEKPDTNKKLQLLYNRLVGQGVCNDDAEDCITGIVNTITNEYGD